MVNLPKSQYELKITKIAPESGLGGESKIFRLFSFILSHFTAQLQRRNGLAHIAIWRTGKHRFFGGWGAHLNRDRFNFAKDGIVRDVACVEEGRNRQK
jgi:hypothetical protein